MKCPVCHKIEIKAGIWCANCYVDFARKHQVFGGAAVELKREMDQQSKILEPKLRPNGKLHS